MGSSGKPGGPIRFRAGPAAAGLAPPRLAGKEMSRRAASPGRLGRPVGRLATAAVAGLACLALWACSGKLPAPERIILISIDTLRADYVGAYGYTRFPTSPHLDAFAAANLLFDASIVVEPFTLTSHMSLLTGLFPQHHRVRGKAALSGSIPTLASLLRAQGHVTQAFVDGGYLDRHWGFDQGFDDYRQADGKGLQAILPQAVDWIERHRDRRFFLFLHTYDVHSRGLAPYYESPAPFRGAFSAGSGSDLESTTRAEFVARWQEKAANLSAADEDYIRSTYAEGVRFVDEELGRLFAFLEASGLYDDALVIVWSDHGEGLYDHELWAHGELYDHTIRVPLLMKIPGAAGGKRIRSVVSAVDILPTVLELARAPLPGRLDGRSLLPLLRDDPGGGAAFSIQARHRQRLFSIRSAREHYISDLVGPGTFFFDLREDPAERENLSPSGAAREAALAERLAGWIGAYDAARREKTVRREPEQALGPELRDRLRALGYVEEKPR